jgi:low affinity Fe/Cu permease
MNGSTPGWRFSQLARAASRTAGHPIAFLVAAGIILAWAMTGPLFGFNDTWQLVINTATTIITFLMVFLIQNSQNRDTVAMQLKLDELVRSIKAARNTVLNLEELEEHELERLLKKYQKIGSDARRKTIVEPPPAPEGEHEEAPRIQNGVTVPYAQSIAQSTGQGKSDFSLR